MDRSKPILKENIPLSFQSTVVPTAPYSARAPSPPYIHVPPPMNPHFKPSSNPNHHNDHGNGSRVIPGEDSSANLEGSDVLMTIRPSPSAVHTTGLAPHELHIVTQGGRAQSARDGSSNWVYESRRAAQPVLSYLYLGPASAVKDRAFLTREGITMVLCARDARFIVGVSGVGAGNSNGGMLVNGVRRAVDGMGVEVEGIDIADGRELVGAFSVAARMVNQHLLRVAAKGRGTGTGTGAEFGQGADGGGRTEGGGGGGKVLVVCETGNDRSAAVVAAYLMAMYGLDTVQAVQFMQLKRFCVALGDDFKFQLQAYGDILRARGDVGATGGHHYPLGQGQPGGGLSSGAATGGTVKRRIDQTMGEAGEEGEDGMAMEMDDERYACRNFAPFVDRGY
ncbi:protein-tyrosine phosphatase-like protein [Corynascus novoguineensis]|uniref:Protein-tyrosine phosphatase-like protein n=1 Tax=Corynascus novoguineensis TaxID=1126955 RepID=A0AAN7CTL9_9PEZI|nr:protein-tyrosine phosphatase-like protein [Corynascus novoguineensis]